jgi:hypothetical protein
MKENGYDVFTLSKLKILYIIWSRSISRGLIALFDDILLISWEIIDLNERRVFFLEK